MFKELCEEFMLQHAHLPRFFQEFEGFKAVMTVYVWHPETEENLPMEKWCELTLNAWISIRKKESVWQQKLAQYMGDESPYYFVTINYAKDFIKFEEMRNVVAALSGLKWVKHLDCVHEFYGKDSNHPHTHMLITTHKKMPPSEVIDKVYAVKGLAKLIGGKNFVHLAKNRDKTANDYRAYIQGAKTDSKLENVAKDIEWREKNNLN